MRSVLNRSRTAQNETLFLFKLVRSGNGAKNKPL